MSTLLFANNANTTLAGAITNTAVTLNVQAGAGALFPNPGSGQYFVATMLDAATRTIREIVWVTARSGDTFTVVRAQEGTTAENWLAGDFIANQLTAGQMASFQQGSVVIVNTSLIYFGIDTGVVNSMVVTTNPIISAYADGMVFEFAAAVTTTSTTPHVNIDGVGSKLITHPDGSALVIGELQAANKCLFAYDQNLGNIVLLTTTLTYQTSLFPSLIPMTVFYVSPTGSDSNPGTSALPFLTMTGAVNYIQKYQSSSQVTINVAAGTYTPNGGTPYVCYIASSFIASWNIIGAGVGSTIFNGSSTGQYAFVVGPGVTVSIGAITFEGSIFAIETYGKLVLGNATMTCTAVAEGGIVCNGGAANLSNSTNAQWTFTGSAQAAIYMEGGASQIAYYDVNVSIPLTISLSSFTSSLGTIYATYNSVVLLDPTELTWSGTPTGPRFYVGNNSTIQSRGSGTSYIPGSTAGTVDSSTYGVYQ